MIWDRNSLLQNNKSSFNAKAAKMAKNQKPTKKKKKGWKNVNDQGEKHAHNIIRPVLLRAH
jgi:hypothetical protein